MRDNQNSWYTDAYYQTHFGAPRPQQQQPPYGHQVYLLQEVLPANAGPGPSTSPGGGGGSFLGIPTGYPNLGAQGPARNYNNVIRDLETALRFAQSELQDCLAREQGLSLALQEAEAKVESMGINSTGTEQIDNADGKDKIAELETELKKKEERIKELEAKLLEKDEEKQKLQKRNKELQESNADLLKIAKKYDEILLRHEEKATKDAEEVQMERAAMSEKLDLLDDVDVDESECGISTPRIPQQLLDTIISAFTQEELEEIRDMDLVLP